MNLATTSRWIKTPNAKLFRLHKVKELIKPYLHTKLLVWMWMDIFRSRRRPEKRWMNCIKMTWARRECEYDSWQEIMKEKKHDVPTPHNVGKGQEDERSRGHLRPLYYDHRILEIQGLVVIVSIYIPTAHHWKIPLPSQGTLPKCILL